MYGGAAENFFRELTFSFFVSIMELKNKEAKCMAKKSDYFGLGYLVSVILAIIPVTSWLCGAVTRFTEGKIVAGILRLILGWNIIWIIDLILMILSKHILRLLPI